MKPLQLFHSFTPVLIKELRKPYLMHFSSEGHQIQTDNRSRNYWVDQCRFHYADMDHPCSRWCLYKRYKSIKHITYGSSAALVAPIRVEKGWTTKETWEKQWVGNM